MDTKRLVVPDAEEVLGRYFPALDHGFVALHDYMGGDLAVEESARVSYGGGTRKVSDTRTLLRYLFRNRHSSPFEMCEMRFHLGLPIFVMRQLVRHRMANLNEYSGRYSEMPMMFYSPNQEQVCVQAASNRQGRAVPVSNREYLDYTCHARQVRLSSSNAYKATLENDVAREIARIDLPLSMYTYCYWKCDLRNLFNFMSLRSDPHAQWEIQVFSDIICGLVQRVAPLSFEAFQDYQQGSVTFSQVEMSAIRAISNFHTSPVSWTNPPQDIKKIVSDDLLNDGCGKREVDEFWNKIKLRTKKDYTLNLESARDGEYYRKMVAEHAI